MRIGIIGAGQLGQMLGFAARDLEAECRFLDPADSPPASVCGDVVQKPFDDARALAKLAADSDVITYEFENVPVAALQELGVAVPIYPPLQALRQAQDRLDEKRLFERLKIPLPAYSAVDSSADLVAAAESLGLPLVLKTRRLGYDGKGQRVIRSASDIEAAWHALGGTALIAEQWVPFDYEVSSIGVRSSGGETGIYALSQNTHVDGILRTTRSPVEAPQLIAKAEQYMRLLLTELDYVGVLALELFVKDDQLLANEFAPRVHNSGHWTIEGADTSQFENHLRAIMGLPLGSTQSRGYAGMANLIGRIPAGARSISDGVLHDYGKPPRIGRKLGHITVIGETAEQRDAMLDDICRYVNQSTGEPETVA